MIIPKVYLQKTTKATLDYAGLQGFPLYNNRALLKSANREEIYNLLDWLDVEHSARYQPKAGSTHCDCYAGDYCTCRDVYLPVGVFWNDIVIENAQNGFSFPSYAALGSVKKGGTVKELNANGVYDWLTDYGKYFGWHEIYSLTNLQELANKNAVCVISAKNNNPQYPGHIVIVIPEWKEKAAVAIRNKNETVKYPVTSEAGGTCRKISIGDSWFYSCRFLVKYWCNDERIMND